MEEFRKVVSLVIKGVALLIICYVAIGYSNKYRLTPSSMVYTTGVSFWIIVVIGGGLLLLLLPVCLAVRERYLTHEEDPALLASLLIAPLGVILLLVGIIFVPYQTVATIDTDRDRVQFEDRFLSGEKRQIATYNLNEIARIKYVLYRGDSFDDPRFSYTMIILKNGEEISSPVGGEFFAEKLSEYSEKMLVKESNP